jgi:FKBP-type peptidyl-prolyl cis-trans isomerase 2
MIKDGSSVTLHFTMKVDGEVAQSSVGGDPLVYVQGSEQLLPGLEQGLEGLKTGDTKLIEVSPEQGFGPRDPAATQAFAKSGFDDPDALKVGDMVRGQMENEDFTATVVGVGDEEVTLDLNHPLAGKTLMFDVEVVDVS